MGDVFTEVETGEQLQLHARVLASMTEGVSISDESGIILYTNAAQDAMFGYAAGELVGQHVTVQNDYPPEQNQRIVAEVIDQLTRTGTWSGEWRNRRKDGGAFYTFTNITRLSLGGRPHFLCVQRDITEQRHAAVALRESEERYRSLFTSIEDGFCIAEMIFDAAGEPVDYRIVEANPAFAGATGLQNAVGRTVLEMVPDIERRWIETYGRVALTGQPVRFENHVAAWDRWFDVYAFRFGDAARRQVAIFFKNVTERKRSETERERLQAEADAAQGRLIAAFQGSPAFMCVLRGPQHVYEFANEAIYALVGRRQLLGLPVAVAQPELAGQGFIEMLDGVYATGEPFIGRAVPIVLQRVPGAPPEQRYVDFAYQPLREADGSITGIFVHGVDTTNHKHDEQALRESEERFRVAVTATSDILWTNSADGKMQGEQAGWGGFTGQSHDEYKDYGWAKAVHPEDAQPTIDAWNQAVADRRQFVFEHRVRRRDGAYRLCAIRAVPVMNADGSIREWVGVHTDITEQREYERQRERLLESERHAREEAERVSRMKDEFLATLSHELRTPLNAITGWAQLMRGGTLSEEDTRQAVETINRNANAQKQLIEDLLDMSRIISGKVRLDVQRVDLAEVLGSAIESARPTADAKGVRLEKVIDPQAGPVTGDPNRLQQVVWNLLSNAIKFTPKGGKVQVTLERVNSQLEIGVTDTGIGISPAFLPHVFDRFRQADASSTRSHGGLGLGLSIVKQLVEMHNGQVRVTSPGEGKGATFAVALPLAPLIAEPGKRKHPKAEATADQDPVDRPDLGGTLVLVVDDDPDSRELIRRVLAGCGAKVITAGSSADGLDAVLRERPAIIVSDIGMPGEDGYAFIRRVRALDGDLGRIPAVAVTAFARSEDRRQAVRAGYQSHIAKPMNTEELVEIVASFAGRVYSGR